MFNSLLVIFNDNKWVVVQFGFADHVATIRLQFENQTAGAPCSAAVESPTTLKQILWRNSDSSRRSSLSE
jgi:hypothetical protein